MKQQLPLVLVDGTAQLAQRLCSETQSFVLCRFIAGVNFRLTMSCRVSCYYSLSR